jgi:hypothetical protein
LYRQVGHCACAATPSLAMFLIIHGYWFAKNQTAPASS